MATSTRKAPARHATARKLAAEKAEEVARVLHSFAAALISLDALTPANRLGATPRNWWRVQAGRFKDDPTFSDFVAGVQTARKHES